MQFDRLGCFAYSAEENTVAARMDGQIDQEVKDKRAELVMQIQTGIMAQKQAEKVGQTVRVLVEGYGRNEGTLSGRLDNNLTVEFKADPALMGSYAMVRLTGARATVLLGELSE